MLDQEVTYDGVDRRQGTKQRSVGDRRLWLRREQIDRRYGKGRRVWNRRIGGASMESEARLEVRRDGGRRRATPGRRAAPEPERRGNSNRRNGDRRIA